MRKLSYFFRYKVNFLPRINKLPLIPSMITALEVVMVHLAFITCDLIKISDFYKTIWQIQKFEQKSKFKMTSHIGCLLPLGVLI